MKIRGSSAFCRFVCGRTDGATCSQLGELNLLRCHFRLNADEYAQLMGNFVEVVETHEDLLLNIEVSAEIRLFNPLTTRTILFSF